MRQWHFKGDNKKSRGILLEVFSDLFEGEKGEVHAAFIMARVNIDLSDPCRFLLAPGYCANFALWQIP